jgi:predicted ABC-type exoprotein transport system permease subunit
LEILDGFIESMTKMRKLFVGFSASALFLAPIAIVLVIYLIFHPLFSSVLENYGDFGILLSILLGSVIIISGTWFVLGLKQYRKLKQYRIISSWNKRHIQYTRIKEDMQKAFASQFEIEEP